MARTKVLSQETERKIRAWEQLSGVSVLGQQNVVAALARLENDGCDSETLILVLELGRIYPSSTKIKTPARLPNGKHRSHPLNKRVQPTAVRLKIELEERHAGVKDMVGALRSDAKAIERLELAIPAAATLAKNMVTFADLLESLAKYMKFILLHGLFGRALGLTLWTPYFAAELITRKTKTKSPHYSELVEIFSSMLKSTDPSAKMNVVSFSKKITRFRTKNPDFISKFTKRRRLEDEVRELVEEWKEAESALKRESKGGGLKLNSSVTDPEAGVHSSKFGVQVQSSTPAFKSHAQSSNPEVKSSKFGVQVQGTPRASSSNPPTAAKKKPGHQT